MDAILVNLILPHLTNIEELTMLRAPVGWLFFTHLVNPTMMPRLRKIHICGSFFVHREVFGYVTSARGFEARFEVFDRRVSVAGVDIVPASSRDIQWNESLMALYSVLDPGPVYLSMSGTVQGSSSSEQHFHGYLRDGGHVVYEELVLVVMEACPFGDVGLLKQDRRWQKVERFLPLPRDTYRTYVYNQFRGSYVLCSMTGEGWGYERQNWGQ
ncbi:hypothetical protein VNI00_016587 [Paramarasmius palmivorus]|uniref:Uncharacterized protein n=1 Tax=Paramarasmius palmivorus TaxID=297713 RepID=A0AAW0BCF2_9AGAR